MIVKGGPRGGGFRPAGSGPYPDHALLIGTQKEPDGKRRKANLKPGDTKRAKRGGGCTVGPTNQHT